MKKKSAQSFTISHHLAKKCQSLSIFVRFEMWPFEWNGIKDAAFCFRWIIIPYIGFGWHDHKIASCAGGTDIPLKIDKSLDSENMKYETETSQFQSLLFSLQISFRFIAQGRCKFFFFSSLNSNICCSVCAHFSLIYKGERARLDLNETKQTSACISFDIHIICFQVELAFVAFGNGAVGQVNSWCAWNDIYLCEAM